MIIQVDKVGDKFEVDPNYTPTSVSTLYAWGDEATPDAPLQWTTNEDGTGVCIEITSANDSLIPATFNDSYVRLSTYDVSLV